MYLYAITYSHYYDFGTWAAFFITPLLYLVSLLHAGLSGDASIMSGVFAAILNIFFVLSMGYTLVSVSITKYLLRKYLLSQSTLSITADSEFLNVIQQIIYYADLVLGGGVVCLFFWMVIYAAWHFYCFNRSRDHIGLQSNGDEEQPQIASELHAQQNEYDTSFVPEQ